MEYNFSAIETKWQEYWMRNKTFRAETDPSKPKYYVLDMFPYPSGSGLHVGHPLGYIASDIYSRYKRLKGFNVLHPMGYDAFGLPAEQYAIQTGTHPAITTEKNIARYREQMDKIGFSYDWDREVKTCDPAYYKWTQWTFVQLFNHWYNLKTRKAEPISELVAEFESSGNASVEAAMTGEWFKNFCRKYPSFGEYKNGIFSGNDWKSFPEKLQRDLLMNYRLAYQSDAIVNWCPQLGTVLANDEVKDGFSVRGGYPVERKLMRQWFLRITAYAERLLEGLDSIDFSESLKEIQKNWIGRSEGAEIAFPIDNTSYHLDIFTTRPDTIFGSTFMVIAPEHDLAEAIASPDCLQKVRDYIHWAKNRSERERMSEVKKISGEFTGAYCLNPLNGKKIPVWVADYVLAGYGTGAIMAVPAHDSRDYDFAKHFNLPIVEVVSGGDISESSYDAKDGILINSEFINGMNVKEAVSTMIRRVEELKIGRGTVNYRLRDAIFSRQRYWGEPFPVYYKDGIPYVMDESELPLVLPEVESYLPTETGEPPLARAKNWQTKDGYHYETSTMPGFAGSSGYYLRYMDPRNDNEYFSKEANQYWQDVDLYLGGAEHAVGHLVYSRFWNKFLYDIGLVCKEEPYKKLINQGMIQGRSSIVYRLKNTNTFVSLNLKKDDDVTDMHVDVSLVENDVLDLDGFKNWRPDLVDAEFILEDGKFICGWEIEKMSKSLHNVVNPDALIERYGADTLRLYEMFLGPLEQSKPWDTNGIEGVFRFIRKFWRLYHDRENLFSVTDEEPTAEELKILHKTIKKVQDDIERFSFNTAVSNFMICVNELSDLKCNKRAILEPLVILIAPYAPHMAEELWESLGHTGSISFASFPEYKEEFTVENAFTYPVSFNGKLRFQLPLPLSLTVPEIEQAVLAAPDSAKWLQGKPPKKIIVVPGKIVNVVVG
ncbi:MAG: leucine--tRNA ligase [Bacteroidetes bacterium]|nr:leucine--tRNA ligase [Bacteroidota bacterium]